MRDRITARTAIYSWAACRSKWVNVCQLPAPKSTTKSYSKFKIDAKVVVLWVIDWQVLGNKATLSNAYTRNVSLITSKWNTVRTSIMVKYGAHEMP